MEVSAWRIGNYKISWFALAELKRDVLPGSGMRGPERLVHAYPQPNIALPFMPFLKKWKCALFSDLVCRQCRCRGDKFFDKVVDFLVVQMNAPAPTGIFGVI